MNKYSIDVIIPIFNQERYLARCLDSILCQDMNNIRLILVNDGSTDLSLSICENYKEKYSNIIIIDKKNGGVSSARNAGLDKANADYITFIDPDDCVESNYFSTVEELLEIDKCLAFSYCIKHIDFGNTEVCVRNRVCSTGEAIVELQKSGLFNSPCNKVYSRRIIEDNKIRFIEKSDPGEDLLFNCEYFKYIKIIKLSNAIIYNYMRNGENSLANKFRADLWIRNKSFIKEIETLYEFYGLNDIESQKGLALSCIAYIHSNIPNMYRKHTKFAKKDRIAFYDEILKEKKFNYYFSILETEDKLFNTLKKIYNKGSAKKMDFYYSCLMFIRNNLQVIYTFFRKTNKK